MELASADFLLVKQQLKTPIFVPYKHNPLIINMRQIWGGNIDADVSNRIQVEGSVNIDNRVDVNLSAINGYRNCFYNNFAKHPNDFYRIPVTEY